MINADLSRNTGHTRLRNKSGSIEVAHPLLPLLAPLFPSIRYTRTKRFQPRGQFRDRTAATRAYSARGQTPDRSEKCFVKRQESVVINGRGRSGTRSQRGRGVPKEGMQSGGEERDDIDGGAELAD
jgi:hypothetical protein